jgi:hypothetical protein
MDVAELVTMAECAAQHIGSTDPPGNDAPGLLSADADAAATNSDAHVDGASAGTYAGAPNATPQPRAKQSTPRALRCAVLQHRCRVAGCWNATFLDVHRVTARQRRRERREYLHPLQRSGLRDASR